MDDAQAVADAVLYEGYLLYPYRASAAKNQIRWQWGVLMPPGYPDERSSAGCEVLAEPAEGAVLHVRVRFLQLQARTVEVGSEVVPSVVIEGTEYLTWDEAVEQAVDLVLPFGPGTHPFTVDGGTDVEDLGDARLVRTRWPLTGRITLSVTPLVGPFGGFQLGVDVENTTDAAPADRDDALRHALVSTHALMSLSAGKFLSATDPPEWASVATRECRSDGLWPVLTGDGGTVLCSPIILYDYPSIAPESAGNLYDGTEIDEILTLRTITLTDAEKREARATDPRAAEIIDRVDNMPPELMDRLHGTVRYLRSVTNEPDSVTVNGVRVTEGSRVRLKPNRRADAHDMFLVDRVATVQAVLLDVDDGWHVAVALEGEELYAAHGRYRYFAPDEIEPLP